MDKASVLVEERVMSESSKQLSSVPQIVWWATLPPPELPHQGMRRRHLTYVYNLQVRLHSLWSGRSLRRRRNENWSDKDDKSIELGKG